MSNKIGIAIIGGTGLNQLAGVTLSDERSVVTPYGAVSAPLQQFKIDGLKIDGREFIFLARHGRPHRLPPHKINYRANLWALRDSGVTTIIAINAVGGITAAMTTATIVIPHQLVDYTWGREHTYHSDDSLDHIDFTHPYTPTLRAQIIEAASAANIAIIDSGVYAATQGPRLETAAEINRLQHDGCDIVGMTGMPEAALARELGMDYASIGLVVNPAAGRAPGEITMTDMQRVIDEGMERVQQLVLQALTRIN